MSNVEITSPGNEIQEHSSGEGEKVVQDEVVISIEGMFKKFSPVSPDRCIYRVHQALRKLNPEAYTPRVVSIGPLHRGNPSLQVMEEHKLLYLQNFLKRFNVSLKDCVQVAQEMEKRARNCYADNTSDLKSVEFVNMLLVDAAFIIVLLLKRYSYYWAPIKDDYIFYSRIFDQQIKDDYIFSRPKLLDQVVNDIILLENQLPFFVVQELYNKFVPVPRPNLLECTCLFKYFKGKPTPKTESPNLSSSTEVKHFTDFLRTCLKPTPKTESPRKKNISYGSIPNAQKLYDAGVKFMKSMRTCRKPTPKTESPETESPKKESPESEKIPYGSIPNAQKLYDAGVKFKLSSSKCIVDIQYKDGELQIPHFNVGDWAESFYRNLIAFELCHCVTDTYVIDGLRLMDGLINTPRDVDLLVDAGIIHNGLGDNHAVTTLFNNLLKEITLRGSNYFDNIYEDLNAYCKAPTNRWKAVFKRESVNYFGTPFRTVSTFAAVTLLVLTLLQTIWTIKESK